jgi:pimeloyl-ACP methyl ester carboxylesterase
MKITVAIAFLIIKSLLVFSQNINIQGIIKDKNQHPIPYVYFGIEGKVMGTVADSLGVFNLKVNKSLLNNQDSIVVSRTGFKSKRFHAIELLTRKNYIEIILEPNLNTFLNEVIVNEKKLSEVVYGRTKGNLVLNPRAYTKMYVENDLSGLEQATIIDIDDDILIKSIDFLLIRNKLENLNVRLNIYSVVNGEPGDNILNRNIVFKVAQQSGWNSIDLSKYNIRIKGENKIAIGLEILNKAPDSTKYSYLIPSYPSIFKKSFYREKSFSKWNSASNSHLYINIKAMIPTLKASIRNKYQEDEPDLKLIFGNNPNIGKICKVDSGEIYYETYGKGKPLILLHGNGESISSFREQVGLLSNYFNVIALDSRGQGNSEDYSKSRYTYELFSKDVITLMDTLKIKKASILGWSDGGNIGILLALNHSNRVDKLITMGANIFHGTDAISEEVISIFKNRKEKIQQNPFFKNNNAEARLINLVLEEPNISPNQLNRIQGIPVLLIAGENDVIKLKHSELIEKSISNSKLLILKETDHYAPLKNPELFNKTVLDFLNNSQ